MDNYLFRLEVLKAINGQGKEWKSAKHAAIAAIEIAEAFVEPHKEHAITALTPAPDTRSKND